MINFNNMQYVNKPYYFFLPQELATQLKLELAKNNLEEFIIESIHAFAFDDTIATKFPKHRKTTAWSNLTKNMSPDDYQTYIKQTKEYFESTDYPDTTWIGVIKTTIEPKYLQNMLLKFYGPTIDTDYKAALEVENKRTQENAKKMLDSYETK